MMGSMSHMLLQWWVGTTATVRGVMAASIFVGSIWSDSSTSQNTGTPPATATAIDVAAKPRPGQITSVPGPTPTPTNAACSAPVPELTPMAYLAPNFSRASSANCPPLDGTILYAAPSAPQ